MFGDFEEMVEGEVRPLIDGYVLTSPTATLDLEAASEVFAVLQFLEGRLKDRKAEIRQLLLSELEQRGKTTSKGGNMLDTNFGTAVRERRDSKLPDENAVKLLLTKKEIPLTLAFSKVTTTTLDPSKLASLVDRGLLTNEDLDATREVSYALKFKANARTLSLLESGVGRE